LIDRGLQDETPFSASLNADCRGGSEISGSAAALPRWRQTSERSCSRLSL
jgi:hypothetical protein